VIDVRLAGLNVCVSSNIFFQLATSPTVFSPILSKLGTRDIGLCANTLKNRGTDFRNFDQKIFGEFLKIYIWN